MVWTQLGGVVLVYPTEKEVRRSWASPGTVEVGDEDGGFRRRFGGTDAHMDT